MIKGMELLSYEDRLGELGLFRPEKPWEDLTATFQYLERAYEKEGVKIQKIILQSKENIHLLSSSKESRFLSLDAEDENAPTVTGKAKADGPAQRPNPGETPVMGYLSLMFEEVKHSRNTTTLSNGK
ncbi:hypothetical protein WISP_23098 [Willisornis vidua]|uniref:Uncharacterized protein n=1 Tax=Willisornis vidua TaxID=1566151 RepID=A0ABQ9DML5_9PASS|nr:hypothetical protein WISP_23098 [Willisornis vidua]